ncbi:MULTISPECIES: DUF1102 domain-containing protein [Halorubrum]|uniref:CARDB domain-containing protein n=1 Tax=Halorubrum hochstenium ATCC 700873 TaxID=1227481 RepID=M0FLC7_9EURY|nr:MULTISPECIES: DUF1102 domain-containing protein [Halorubrum]ELZ59389.1 hypothetical protein C467_03906 [Halorubrum hochstenium ATCC 700873]
MPTARRTAIAIVLLAAAATALAFATGAAVVDGPADRFAEERLAVQPADGPNGNYAYLNDDEIVVDVSASNPNLGPDFEGVNPDALASADGVFEITYTADEYARVWIDHAEENVTFVADGRSIEGRSNNVTLGPNETVAVGLRVDTHGAAAGTTLDGDDFDIRAEVAEPESVGETATDNDDGSGGASTTVRELATDRREFEGRDLPAGEGTTFDAGRMRLSAYATLDRVRVESADGSDVAFETVGSPEPFASAGPLTDSRGARPEAYFELNHSFTTEEVSGLRFGFSVDRAYLNETGADPADVSLYRRSEAEPDGWERLPTERVDPAVRDIRGLPEDRVHLTATTDDFSVFAVATERPVFRPTSASLDRDAVDPGDSVAVRATVANEGGADGERPVTLTADGDPVATERVALAPDETTVVAFETSFEAAGAYDLAVDGTPAGTLVVGDPSGDGTGEGSASVGDDGASDPPSDGSEDGGGPTEEPSGIDLSNVAGLVILLVVTLAGVALVRRMPRS